MFDFNGAPFFVFVPFISFGAIFCIVIAVKLCAIFSRRGSLSLPHWCRTRQPVMVPRSVNTEHSTSSVHNHSLEGSNEAAQDLEPPSYYAGIMATGSSSYYPMYVPPYNVAPPPIAGGSLRDPRHFQGLAGIQAPPPYPPPPSYSQLGQVPELLSNVTNTRLCTATSCSTSKSPEAFPPVD